ncbi:Mrp/NBP35 family ATP-binding protein [Hyphobacterium marinum]|uniref:Iron-sulfur cluster carrier protein n=1 Tax=Hyphobacterium marinum TaxID=3116574 RepID=A0ABU7LY73_9PROT|nr:Mrp/NBP35 family ATP-binding protein [Hyphobacterium sp. Y6023]MEE2566503.1 Mrp/NBP35 family ATP-binding protein [Hyphobacterium sp. Y6023]
MTDSIQTALNAIPDTASGKGLVSAGRIDGTTLKDGVATVVLKVRDGDGDAAGREKAAIEAALMALDDVRRVRLITTLERAPGKPQARKPNATPAAPEKRAARHVIAVAAGKGGVGKSTVAANLAVALTRQGRSVGILDADIYGPSIPRLFGLSDAQGLKKTDSGITPLSAHGVKIVSMGLLTKPGAPVVWRGPMVQGAIQQFLRDTDWGDLDVLIIDMPPGTGDAQLAIAQTAAIDGAVIACTPQDLALDDARKAMAMFQQTHTPLLGLIENMSVFLCPHCGEPSEIFGHGGARDEAEALGLPFLGEIPLHIDLRKRSDEGRPVALDDGPVSAAFARAADAVLAASETARKPAPDIVFE